MNANSLKDPKVKKGIGVAGGAFAVLSGLRELRKNEKDGSATNLKRLHVVLKIVVAAVGILVALRAVEDVVEDAS